MPTTMEPRPDLGHDCDGQHQSEHEADGQGPLARAGAVHLATGAAHPVPGCEARRLDDMTQDMDRHRSEPEDETDPVQLQHFSANRARTEEQGDTRAEHDRRQDDNDRAEDPEHGHRRSFAAVLLVPQIVLADPPEGASHLQQDGWDEEHADEHVRREQATDAEDRESLGSQEHEQHGGH